MSDSGEEELFTQEGGGASVLIGWRVMTGQKHKLT